MSRLWLALACVAALAQEAPVLRVDGAVREPLALTTAHLSRMQRATAAVTTEGKTLRYEGVRLRTLLELAGVGELRGKSMASYLVATAKDGYRVVFSLAELDPAFADSEVLIADHLDGKLLDERTGPLRLVAPKDKRGARSVRMLTRLEVVMLRE